MNASLSPEMIGEESGQEPGGYRFLAENRILSSWLDNKKVFTPRPPRPPVPKLDPTAVQPPGRDGPIIGIICIGIGISVFFKKSVSV